MKQLILSLVVLFTIVSVAFSQAAHHSKNKADVQLDSLFTLGRLAAAKKTIEQLEGGK